MYLSDFVGGVWNAWSVSKSGMLVKEIFQTLHWVRFSFINLCLTDTV